MSWQVDVVTSILSGRHVALMPPITPVLYFLDVEWPLIGAPDSCRGVRLESPRSIKRLFAKTALLTEPEEAHLFTLLGEALPPK